MERPLQILIHIYQLMSKSLIGPLNKDEGEKPALPKVRSCRRISEIARDNGLTALPTAANFVAIDCGRDDAYAKAVLDGLIDVGVFVRMPFVAPQNRCIRISAGTEADLDILAEALSRVLDRL